MQVTLTREPYGCYLLTAEDGREVLIQTDWDYPGTAANLGFIPCECGTTDGTVDCRCPRKRKAGDMISAAADFLDDHDGESFDDPGYFD